MPIFYFDISDHFDSTDHEGTELPGVIHARMEAVKFAGVHLSQKPELVWNGNALRVLVFDDQRTLLTTVTISASDTPDMHERIEAEEIRKGAGGQRGPG